MTKADVLLGLQWGDEGKGKAIDAISIKNNYDGAIRFQGGPNAGHTLEFDGKKTVLHIIPSNIFNENCKSVIGNGIVLDPVIFMQEISNLIQNFSYLFTIDELKNKIIISNKCHIILPSHKILDKYQEQKKGKDKCGTTGKGIGPTYGDKISRVGLRSGDILNTDFELKAKNLYYEHLSIVTNKYPEMVLELDVKQLFTQWLDAINFLKKFTIIDTAIYLNKAISNGKKYLGEGAQGFFLDLDHGTYPMVTASNTSIGGFFNGSGVSPKHLCNVYGLFKAYTTRVGEGPFPTELFDATGKLLQTQGNEFGSTTGRPRRCGWLDLVMLKYACTISGVTELIMSKADVLNGMPTIKVCIAYQNDYGFPDEKAKPIYKAFKGWKTLIDEKGILSKNFLHYIKFIEEYLNLPITIISTGPNRNDIIWR